MNGYLWLKAFHLIAIVCWFAGIFYLPRLFVNHASTNEPLLRERFGIMEEKLYRIIMRPSMIVSVVLGLWMLVLQWSALAGQGWIWVKIVLVVGLLGYHHYCGALIRRFADAPDQASQPHSEKFFRIFNEIPVLALIIIVLLAVLKPF